VLRDTGDVVTMECVEKLIKPDMRNPISGKILREKDIIPLQRVYHSPIVSSNIIYYQFSTLFYTGSRVDLSYMSPIIRNIYSSFHLKICQCLNFIILSL